MLKENHNYCLFIPCFYTLSDIHVLVTLPYVCYFYQMKNKVCTIKQCLPYGLHVETCDGYEWIVNPEVIEPVDVDQHKEESLQRCFKPGDIVKIKNMTKNEMKKVTTHHGIIWQNEVYHVSITIMIMPPDDSCSIKYTYAKLKTNILYTTG